MYVCIYIYIYIYIYICIYGRLYQSGYIELAAQPYTPNFCAPLAHVTNLSPHPHGSGAGGVQRQYASEDFITYLTRASATPDEHRLGQELVGGVAALCSTALSTLSLFRPLAREEGCGSDAADELAQGKWKRFGGGYSRGCVSETVADRVQPQAGHVSSARGNGAS